MDLLLPILQSSWASKIIAPALVILAITGFWFRAGSIYTLLDRAWVFMAGKAEVADPELKKFIQDARAVEKFRFMFGIKVRCLADIQRVISWINYYSIDVVMAHRARRWIDLNQPDFVKIPPVSYIKVRWGFVVALSIALAFMPQVFFAQNALLQMKESKVWFVSDSKTVSHIRSRWTVKAEDCNKSVAELEKLTEFNESEVEAVCSALRSDELYVVVKRSIQQQRGLSVGLCAVFFYFLSILFFRIVAFHAIKDIKKAIDKSCLNV